MGGQSCAVAYGLLLVASLVEDHSANGKLDRRRAIERGGHCSFEIFPKLRHLRDVRRVDADERTSRDCTVQLRLSSRDLRSSIRAGHVEAKVTARALDGLIGRRDTAQHKRGPFRVQVGVGVLNKSKRGPDVGECEGHVGGGGKKNRGHLIVSFQDSWSIQRPFIVYIIPDRAGKVNTFFVKGLQTVCQPLAAVVVAVSRAVHVSNIAHGAEKYRALLCPVDWGRGYLWAASVEGF